MLYKFEQEDLIYDLEVLQNLTTNAVIYPTKKKIYIAIHTYHEVNSPINGAPLPKIRLTDEQIEIIRQAVYKENQYDCEKYGITPENIIIFTTQYDEYGEPDETEMVQQVYDNLFYPEGYCFSFNGMSYDSAILAWLAQQTRVATHGNAKPYTLDALGTNTFSTRKFSNKLIESEDKSFFDIVKEIPDRHRNLSYWNFRKSQWHIDIRLLNVKQKFTSLKRQGLQMGYKIKTSKKLGEHESIMHTFEDVVELLVYNVSDIFLTINLFSEPENQTQFEVGKQLLDEFQDILKYNDKIKRDTTLPNFAAFAISPNDEFKLIDDAVATFAYPMSYGYASLRTFTDNNGNVIAQNLDQFNQLLTAYLNTLPENIRAQAGAEHPLVLKYTTYYDEVLGKIVPNPIYRWNHQTLQMESPYDSADEFNKLINRFKKVKGINYTLEDLEQLSVSDEHIVELNKILKDEFKEDYPTIRLSEINLYEHEELLQYALDKFLTDKLCQMEPFKALFENNRLLINRETAMVDLLEFIKYKYPNDLHEHVYDYYASFRNENTQKYRRTKPNVQDNYHVNRLIKKREELTKKHNINLVKGADQLMPNNVPVQNRMTIGGAHGSEIDLGGYLNHVKEVTSFNKGLNRIKEKIENNWDNLTKIEQLDFKELKIQELLNHLEDFTNTLATDKTSETTTEKHVKLYSYYLASTKPELNKQDWLTLFADAKISKKMQDEPEWELSHFFSGTTQQNLLNVKLKKTFDIPNVHEKMTQLWLSLTPSVQDDIMAKYAENLKEFELANQKKIQNKRTKVNKILESNPDFFKIEYAIQSGILPYDQNNPKKLDSTYISFGPKAEGGGKFKGYKNLKEASKFQVTTDVTNAVHIDIESYYPTLIILFKMFLKRGQIIDRYAAQKDKRVKLKNQLPEDPALWTDNDYNINLLQLALKLLINGASGKADDKLPNNIRMNNRIIRARMCGQLIILALAFEIANTKSPYDKGYGIPCSINTDGIFAYNITKKDLAQIVEGWNKLYQLKSEVESLKHFVSKDSNNRIEMFGDEISRVSGSTIRYADGPNLEGACSKPMIIDRMLTRYMTETENNPEPLEVGFKHDEVRKFIEPLCEAFLNETPYQEGSKFKKKTHIKDLRDLMIRLSHPFISDTRKERVYVFQQITADEQYPEIQNAGQWSYPSSVNRGYYVKDSILTDPMFNQNVYKTKFIARNANSKDESGLAANILKAVGLYKAKSQNKGVVIEQSINGIEKDQLIYLNNDDCGNIPKELLKHIDYDTYVNYTESQWLTWSSKSHTIKQRSEYIAS